MTGILTALSILAVIVFTAMIIGVLIEALDAYHRR
jgi:hypothetical protein